MKETYVVVFQSGTSVANLDQEEFHSVRGAANSVMPRFAVYDAVLEGNTLHYLFTKMGEVYLAKATVSTSGEVSGYRKTLTSDTFSTIQDAHFVKDHEGKVILRIRKMGKNAEAFQFDGAGDAVSVPVESAIHANQHLQPGSQGRSVENWR